MFQMKDQKMNESVEKTAFLDSDRDELFLFFIFFMGCNTSYYIIYFLRNLLLVFELYIQEYLKDLS